jgi:hypothetical protein
MKPLGIAFILSVTARDRDRSRKPPPRCNSVADGACESFPMAYERDCHRRYHECLCQGQRKYAAGHGSR